MWLKLCLKTIDGMETLHFPDTGHTLISIPRFETEDTKADILNPEKVIRFENTFNPEEGTKFFPPESWSGLLGRININKDNHGQDYGVWLHELGHILQGEREVFNTETELKKMDEIFGRIGNTEEKIKITISYFKKTLLHEFNAWQFVFNTSPITFAKNALFYQQYFETYLDLIDKKSIRFFGYVEEIDQMIKKFRKDFSKLMKKSETWMQKKNLSFTGTTDPNEEKFMELFYERN